MFPEDDGLWRIDLATGEARLLLSCSALRGMVPDVPATGMAYICHTVISKDSKRLFFLLRSVTQSMEGVKRFQGVNWQTTAFTCNADGTSIRRCFPDGEFVCGDGYWDDAGFRHWKIARLADGAVRDIGSFFVPALYRETYSRCDLHPRWRADGQAIAFNSVHEETRQIYIIETLRNRA